MSSFSLGYRVLNLGSSLCNASEYIENYTLKKTMDVAGTAAFKNGSHGLFVSYQTDINLQKKGRNKHKSVRFL